MTTTTSTISNETTYAAATPEAADVEKTYPGVGLFIVLLSAVFTSSMLYMAVKHFMN